MVPEIFSPQSLGPGVAPQSGDTWRRSVTPEMARSRKTGRSQGPPISLKGAPSMTCLLGTLACLPETQSHCVAQGGLQFGTLLPQVRIFKLGLRKSLHHVALGQHFRCKWTGKAFRGDLVAVTLGCDTARRRRPVGRASNLRNKAQESRGLPGITRRKWTQRQQHKILYVS